MLNDLKQYEDALPLFEKIENYNRQRFGKKDKETFDAMRNVALTLNYLGQHEEAKQRLEKFLKKESQELGCAQLLTKSTLARVLLESGHYNRAINLLEELLKKRRETYGEKHHAFGLILQRLAYAYHLKGDVEKEKSCVEKLEQILADELFENAEDKINTQDTLVLLYIDLGEYEKATALAVKMIDAFIPYLYAPEQFEVVEDEEKEPFVLYKDTAKVVEFQQIPLCDYNEMKATILEDGTFSISGVDETWKSLGFMTFDDDGYDNDDYDFSYDFTKVGTKKLFALLQDKDPYTVKTDTDLKELLNLGVIQKRFASKEGVDELFEICDKSGIDYTGRNY